MGGLMDPAVCWGLAIGSHQHHKQCFLPLSIGENIALCAESIHGLTYVDVSAGLFHCLQKRHASMRLAVILRWGLEMVCKGASNGLQIDDGW